MTESVHAGSEFDPSGPAGWEGAALKIYTRGGDDGTTGLLFGARVAKDDPRTEAYGDVDEAVSALGLARSLSRSEELAGEVLTVQRELFSVASQLATPVEEWGKLVVGTSRVAPEAVTRIEEAIDVYITRFQMPQGFVIPGETQPAAALDVARTVVRRAERRVVALERAGMLPDRTPLHYLNRLSDFLFVLARFEEGESRLVRGQA